MGIKKYRVSCPFSSQPEYVYLYVLNGATAFNGCDNSYHNCVECNEICKAKALQLYDQELREGPLPHVHSPV